MPVESENLLFISQLLYERTFHYSLDSVKARTLNAPFLIKEASDQVELHLKHGVPEHNARIVVDEMNHELSGNAIVGKLTCLSPKRLKVNLDSPWQETLETLSFLTNIISPYAYASTIFSDLENEINFNHKKKIYFLVGELITTLVNMKVSAAHIHHCTKNIFFQKRQMNRRSFRRLIKAIDPVSHEYAVCLKVSSKDMNRLDISLFGVNFLDEIPEKFKAARPSKDFLHSSKNSKYVVIDDFTGKDVHSACILAKNRIEAYVNLSRMFDHKIELEIHDEALVDQCCLSGINVVKHSINRMHYVSWQKRDKLSERVETVISELRLKQDRYEFAKFLRVIDMHGMGIASPILENQILNLWTCYETITPTQVQKSTIEAICRAFEPIICLNYVARGLHDLYDRAVGSAPSEFWHELDLKGNNVRIELASFATLLLNDENHERMGKALSTLDEYPFLRFRLNDFWERFGSPNNVIKSIEDHGKRVRWQIRRLYRCRNQIVHAGQLPTFADALFENGHDYFDQVFLTICELSTGAQGMTSLNQNFTYSKVYFEEYLERINQFKEMDDELARYLIWEHYHY